MSLVGVVIMIFSKIKTFAMRFLFVLFALAFSTSLYALPSIEQYIHDLSGEYVYYSDSSFSRTSYLGILYYNDSTYAFRYYAPVDVDQHLPAKDITVYFTIDTETAYLNLTGEHIEGEASSEDAEIINYLHDMFYEFTARRQNAEFVADLESVNDANVPQEFMQFGGDVVITFNSLIPIFNIKSIKKADGTFVMRLQTVGRLRDSTDLSFTSFKGVDNLPQDTNHSFKKAKGTKNQKYTFENQQVTLDTAWQQVMENQWLLGDNASLLMATMNVPDMYKDNPSKFEDAFIRRMTEGSQMSYPVQLKQKITRKKNVISISNIFYEQETSSVIRDFKVLTSLGNGKYAYMELHVFDGAYQSSKSYFDSIIKSYKAK